jgi:hypothetical protein
MLMFSAGAVTLAAGIALLMMARPKQGIPRSWMRSEVVSWTMVALVTLLCFLGACLLGVSLVA